MSTEDYDGPFPVILMPDEQLNLAQNMATTSVKISVQEMIPIWRMVTLRLHQLLDPRASLLRVTYRSRVWRMRMRTWRRITGSR